MNGMKKTILLYGNLIMAMVMCSFAFATFLDAKIYLTILLAAVGMVMLAIVRLTALNHLKLEAKRIK
ncbi:hypothetical protein [Bacillus tuaregi]|uniref:hypothetical protein n=1 Tax=Bacillus tuaregi TaxID=1816695 RepID=UPI0008F85C44|nr:hypothetical protein [Bacillus tuaregi]